MEEVEWRAGWAALQEYTREGEAEREEEEEPCCLHRQTGGQTALKANAAGWGAQQLPWKEVRRGPAGARARDTPESCPGAEQGGSQD